VRVPKSALGISWIGFQIILSGVAFAICIILWLLKGSPDVVGVVVTSFITGNLTILGLHYASPLFDQPFPRNWIVYLAVLLPIGAVSGLVASLVLRSLYPASAMPLFPWLFFNAGIATVFAMITGISMYAIQDTRSRLEADKEKLRREVFQGLKRVQAQERQLQAAFEIQTNLLPKVIPQIPGIQISCAWQPAQVVSGDYFDVIALSERKVAVCLADVAGKGMGAAMLMANLQAAFRAFLSAETSPGALCRKLNETLCAIAAPGKFVTFFYGVIDCEEMTLRYENAGHLPPILLRARVSQELTEGGTVLGLFRNAQYQDRVVPLEAGDCLLITTDGVTEAVNRADDEFGTDRVIDAAIDALHSGVHAIRIKVLEEVTAFCDGNFHDDASLMAVVVDPKSKDSRARE
jgi:phosphoserine phosphatase RsbU/P